MENLTGGPAIIYSVLWQTKQMGFLKTILEDIGINNLKVLIYFKDYLPGALLELDGEKGDFHITPVDDPKTVEYDGAFFGELKYVLRLIKGHMFSKGFWHLLKGKIKLKGITSLFKLLKLIGELAI
ncbi:MAG: hypothetical protein ACQERB_15850 [Promethearchaeati archaeon]